MENMVPIMTGHICPRFMTETCIQWGDALTGRQTFRDEYQDQLSRCSMVDAMDHYFGTPST